MPVVWNQVAPARSEPHAKSAGAGLHERRLRAVVEHPTRTLCRTRFEEVDPEPPRPRRDAGDIDAVTGQEVTGGVPEVVVGKCRHERRIDAQPCEGDGDVRLATAEGCVEGPRGCEADAVRRREPQHDLPKSDDASSGGCGHFRTALRAFVVNSGRRLQWQGRRAEPEERELHARDRAAIGADPPGGSSRRRTGPVRSGVHRRGSRARCITPSGRRKVDRSDCHARDSARRSIAARSRSREPQVVASTAASPDGFSSSSSPIRPSIADATISASGSQREPRRLPAFASARSCRATGSTR